MSKSEPRPETERARGISEVPAVSRACAVLDLLAAEGGAMRMAEIAQRLGLPRNSTYGIVYTLAAANMVEVSDGRVSLGLRLFELGGAYAQTVDLIRESRPVAQDLRNASTETTQVAILEGREAVYLVKEDSAQPVRLVSAVGQRVPAHATGIGKAMLAWKPEAILRQLYHGVTLERLTAKTISTKASLFHELGETRKRGYAIDNEESSPEVCCVAAPVFNADLEVVAGLSIAAPASRMPPTRQVALSGLVIEAATRLTRRLGGGRRAGWNPGEE